jgi:hypothetical protein
LSLTFSMLRLSRVGTVLMAVLTGAFLGCAWGRAGTLAADEYEIKASMLINVMRLVEWPARPSEAPPAFIVGISGSEDMDLALRAASEKSALLPGRTLGIRKISTPADIPGCSLVFVGGSDRRRIEAAVQASSTQPILTLGESDRFMTSGGMIGLLVHDGRVAVQINLPAAQAAHLTISSRLLRLATIRTGGTM